MNSYAAGLVDGEGTIQLYIRENGRVDRRVRITGAFPRSLLVELQSTWGGTIRVETLRPHQRLQQLSWTIFANEAAVFLQDILPHLRVKQDEAKVWLAHHNGNITAANADPVLRQLKLKYSA